MRAFKLFITTNNFSKHMISLLLLLTGAIYQLQQMAIISTDCSQRHNSHYSISMTHATRQLRVTVSKSRGRSQCSVTGHGRADVSSELTTTRGWFQGNHCHSLCLAGDQDCTLIHIPNSSRKDSDYVKHP